MSTGLIMSTGWIDLQRVLSCERRGRKLLRVLVVLLIATGCAAPGPAAPAPNQSGLPATTTAPKRLVAAVQSDPPTLTPRMTTALEPGLDAIADLTNPGLVVIDNRGNARPVLAREVPSIENGHWRVLPDGRMETTWRLRDGLTWHDGAAVTSADVLFTHRVDQDPNLPLTPNIAYRSVERIEATDAATVIITWKQPYIEADIAFLLGLLPHHLLEQAYVDDPAGFAQHPYWSREPIGAGPYRVREWERGRSLLLDAFDAFALGRPRIDTVEVRFIPDQNTLIANILAGTVELTLGKTLTAEQAIQVRDQWPSGRVESAPANAVQIFPQLLNPSPAIINNVTFRRALLHAIDRQQLADALVFGLSSVVHSYLSPSDAPEYQAMSGRVVRYEFDPRQAAQLLDGLGYTRGVDGVLRDASGARLAL
jgi:peptide/nickel transport system substrate-binding protein